MKYACVILVSAAACLAAPAATDGPASPATQPSTLLETLHQRIKAGGETAGQAYLQSLEAEELVLLGRQACEQTESAGGGRAERLAAYRRVVQTLTLAHKASPEKVLPACLKGIASDSAPALWRACALLWARGAYWRREVKPSDFEKVLATAEAVALDRGADSSVRLSALRCLSGLLYERARAEYRLRDSFRQASANLAEEAAMQHEAKGGFRPTHQGTIERTVDTLLTAAADAKDATPVRQAMLREVYWPLRITFAPGALARARKALRALVDAPASPPLLAALAAELLVDRFQDTSVQDPIRRRLAQARQAEDDQAVEQCQAVVMKIRSLRKP